MCNTSKALLPKACDEDEQVPQKQTSLVKVTKEIVRAHTSFLQSSRDLSCLIESFAAIRHARIQNIWTTALVICRTCLLYNSASHFYI